MQYYEQAVPGLGLELLDEVERTVSRILLQPEAWSKFQSTTGAVACAGFLTV